MTVMPGQEGAAQPGQALWLNGRLRLIRVLLDGNFPLFWAGQNISKVGNGIYQVTLSWTVYKVTGSTVAMGIVLAANTIPEILLALFGGVLADRFPRKAVILVSDSVAGLVLLALTVIAALHELSMTYLVTAAVLLGVVTAFFRPAYSAMNPELVAREDLQAANSALSIAANVARIVGPALGGIIYGLGGATLAFGIDAASFAVAVVLMLMTKARSSRTRHAAESLRTELAGGMKYTLRTGWLAFIMLVSLVANFACLAPFFVLLPALVRLAHGSAGTLGVLTSAQVAASIAGAAVLGARRMSGSVGTQLLVFAAVIGLGTIVLGAFSAHVISLVVGAILVGLGLSFDVIENSVIQALVPDGLLSRVYSVNMVVSFALLPAGYAVAGFLARWVGTSWVLAGGGAVMIAACCCGALLPSLRRLNTGEAGMEQCAEAAS